MTEDSSKKEEMPVLLNPFVVTSTGDTGYLAQNSVSGTRMNTPIYDVAAPTTSFTQQFLEDIGSTSVDDLRNYMVSTEIVWPEATSNERAQDSPATRVRGLPAVSSSINFFQIPVGDSTLRLDHYNTGRVDQSRGPNSILFGLGSPGGVINISTNRAVLNQVFGSITVSGRSYEGLRAAFDYNVPVIKNRLSLRIDAVSDDKNGWRYHEWDTQKRVYITARWQISRNTTLDFETERGGVNKLQPYPFTAQDNYTPWLLAGKNLTATGATDVPRGIRRLGTTNLPVIETNTGRVWDYINKGAGNFGRIDNITASLLDFSILRKEVTLYGSGFPQKTKYTRMSPFLNHAFTPDLFLELAANQTGTSRRVVLAAGYSFLNVDPNTTLPNGQPNPNAGKAYVEGAPVTTDTYNNDKSLRLSLSFSRNLGRIFGRHQIAAVAETNKSHFVQWQLRQVIVDNPYNLANFITAQNLVSFRTYFDLAGSPADMMAADWTKIDVSRLVDATTGKQFSMEFVNYTAAGSKNNRFNLNTGMAVLQSYFLKDRLVTVFGLRKDRQTAYYSPTSVRDPNPRFSKFVLGPFLTLPGTTPLENDAQNQTFSTVFHTTKWLGLTYNQAANFSLPNPGAALPTATGRQPNPQGKSRDYGIKLNWGQRLYFNALYFQTSAEHDFASSAGPHAYFNQIWDALFAAGKITAAQATGNQTQTNGNTFDSTSKGYEYELIGNVTKQWRIFANYSNSEVRQTNIGRESRAYLDSHRDQWLQGDNARVLLNGSGQLAPVANNNNTLIETVAEGIIDADRQVFDLFILPDGQKPRGQIQHKSNLRTTYAFNTTGWLSGVSIGGGVRYQSAPITNYVITGSSGTGVTARTQILGIENTLFDLNLAKGGKSTWLDRNLRWSLQLNVNNLLDERKTIPTRMNLQRQIISYRLQDPRSFILTGKLTF